MARQEPSQGGYLSPGEEESGNADLTAWSSNEGVLCPGSHAWYGDIHKQTQEVQGLGYAWKPRPTRVKQGHFPALTHTHPTHPPPPPTPPHPSILETGWFI